MSADGRKIIIKEAAILIVFQLLVASFSFGTIAQGGPEVPAASESGWPMFGGCAERGSFSPSNVEVKKNLAWTAHLCEDAGSSPAVAKGTVFLGHGHQVVALDALDGDTVWSFAVPAASVHNDPLIYKNRVYFGTHYVTNAGPAYFYALDMGTGRVAWRTPLARSSGISPLAVDGVIYTTTDKEGIYALNSSDGRILWTAPQQVGTGSSMAYHDGILFGSGNSTLFALDASNRKVIWSKHLSMQSSSSVVYSDGKVLIHGSAQKLGFVAAYNEFNGSMVWTKEFREDNSDSVLCTPAVFSGMVYVGTQDTDRFFCLNLSDGSTMWDIGLDGQVISTPAVSARGIVYVAIKGLYAIDARTGEIRWYIDFGIPPLELSTGVTYNAPLALANGMVFISSGKHTFAIGGSPSLLIPILIGIGVFLVTIVAIFVVLRKRKRSTDGNLPPSGKDSEAALDMGWNT